ncbi:hypothetical protein EVAR_57964_1 [Eumeta japonica]|uniref:Uncharacterized protein n=1 Tax=Eumeta variegata TaxID=151549 RepID=A0A4C1XXS7_EUMVA|nr:hypothetical protein EVAR_57964_1 [Eumeta japonica]
MIRKFESRVPRLQTRVEDRRPGTPFVDWKVFTRALRPVPRLFDFCNERIRTQTGQLRYVSYTRERNFTVIRTSGEIHRRTPDLAFGGGARNGFAAALRRPRLRTSRGKLGV